MTVTGSEMTGTGMTDSAPSEMVVAPWTKSGGSGKLRGRWSAAPKPWKEAKGSKNARNEKTTTSFGKWGGKRKRTTSDRSFPIPSRRAGVVIGKRGSGNRARKEKFGVRTLVKPHEEKDRWEMVELTGSKAGCAAAEAEIRKQIRESFSLHAWFRMEDGSWRVLSQVSLCSHKFRWKTDPLRGSLEVDLLESPWETALREAYEESFGALDLRGLPLPPSLDPDEVASSPPKRFHIICQLDPSGSGTLADLLAEYDANHPGEGVDEPETEGLVLVDVASPSSSTFLPDGTSLPFGSGVERIADLHPSGNPPDGAAVVTLHQTPSGWNGTYAPDQSIDAVIPLPDSTPLASSSLLSLPSIWDRLDRHVRGEYGEADAMSMVHCLSQTETPSSLMKKVPALRPWVMQHLHHSRGRRNCGTGSRSASPSL